MRCQSFFTNYRHTSLQIDKTLNMLRAAFDMLLALLSDINPNVINFVKTNFSTLISFIVYVYFKISVNVVAFTLYIELFTFRNKIKIHINSN